MTKQEFLENITVWRQLIDIANENGYDGFHDIISAEGIGEIIKGRGLSENYSTETVAIVSLLHDICKVNYYKKGFRNVKDEHGKWVQKEVYEVDERFPCGHSEKSIIILQNFIKLSRVIATPTGILRSM